MIIETISYGAFKITQNNDVYYTNNLKFTSINNVVYFYLNETYLEESIDNIVMDNVTRESIDDFMNYLYSYDNNLGYKKVVIYTPEL